MPETDSTAPDHPWYECQRCGNCCRWPGDVHITDAETHSIAEFLGISQHDFVQDYTRLNARRNGLSIIDKPNGECIFLEGLNVCKLQSVKPVHCLGFPNAWNFPGWREHCEAIELPSKPGS